jgi:hypothetical protein
MISFQLDGADKLIAGFKEYKIATDKAMDNAIKQTAQAIETDAKKNLKDGLQKNPKHKRTYRLLPSIYNKFIQLGERFVGTNVHYAPYIEFGTGDFVDIPAGTEAVAAQYKGRGIKKVNIHAISFLYKAMIGQEKKHIERIKTEMNKVR